MIATPIMLLGLLGLLIWGGLWGWRNLTAPLPTPEPTPCVPIERTSITPEDVVVNVYNGGYTRGLAERAATALRDQGFNVARTTNTEEPVTSTIVRGNRDSWFAMRMTGSVFTDVQVGYDSRTDGSIDILVGSEFAGYNDNPETSVGTGSGTYCMPAELHESLSTPDAEESEAAEDEGEDQPSEDE